MPVKKLRNKMNFLVCSIIGATLFFGNFLVTSNKFVLI